jgi:Ca2+/Na+ antiporter
MGASTANETSPDMLKKLLYFASVVEGGTGFALIVIPGLVVALLLGADVAGVGIPVSRCFGIALLALGLACWPGAATARSDSPAFRAMLVYNVLIALFLVYLFTVGHLGGVLLWPGVALHAAVAVLLIFAWRVERNAKATGT